MTEMLEWNTASVNRVAAFSKRYAGAGHEVPDQVRDGGAQRGKCQRASANRRSARRNTATSSAFSPATSAVS